MYLYCLVKNKSPFYIGRTDDPTRREYEHRQEHGKDIEMKILKQIPDSDWKNSEAKWINKMEKMNHRLANKNSGGEGPNKGIKRSPEFGKKISKAKTGVDRPNSEVVPATLAKQKTVVQYNEDGKAVKEYPSAKAAAKALKVNHNSMYDHLGGKFKTLKGYTFKYKK